MTTADRIDTARAALDLAGNTVFAATFTKADGTLRRMVCRLHVQKGVKGTGHPLHDDTPAVRVFDFQRAAFRTIRLDRLHVLRVRGHEFDLDH